MTKVFLAFCAVVAVIGLLSQPHQHATAWLGLAAVLVVLVLAFGRRHLSLGRGPRMPGLGAGRQALGLGMALAARPRRQRRDYPDDQPHRLRGLVLAAAAFGGVVLLLKVTAGPMAAAPGWILRPAHLAEVSAAVAVLVGGSLAIWAVRCEHRVASMPWAQPSWLDARISRIVTATRRFGLSLGQRFAATVRSVLTSGDRLRDGIVRHPRHGLSLVRPVAPSVTPPLSSTCDTSTVSLSATRPDLTSAQKALSTFPATIPKVGHCQWCGIPLPNPRSTYCSPRCRQAVYRRRQVQEDQRDPITQELPAVNIEGGTP